MKILISMPAPHTSSRQLPSQTPQSPVTSGQTTFESSSHSSCRPLAPFSAQTSASLLCSREVCTAQSSPLLRKSTPRPHHSLGRICAATVASTVVFLLCAAVDPIYQGLVVAAGCQLNAIKYSSGARAPWGRDLSALGQGFLHVSSCAVGCLIIFTKAFIAVFLPRRVPYQFLYPVVLRSCPSSPALIFGLKVSRKILVSLWCVLSPSWLRSRAKKYFHSKRCWQR